jgi:hypothetical protein
VSTILHPRAILALTIAIQAAAIGGCARNGAPAMLGLNGSAGERRIAPRGFEVPADRYLAHVAVLSHDSLKGRGTGDAGNEVAAGYIAGQFAAAGLSPGGDDGTFFQEFTITRGGRLGEGTRLAFEGVDVPVQLNETFVPFGFSSLGEFTGGVVFVGYGATLEDPPHDDYADVDVTGKVVLMLRRMPEAWADASFDANPAVFTTKMKLAEERGAAAVLIVNQSADEQDDLMPFRRGNSSEQIPAIHIKRAAVDAILAAGGEPSLSELQAFLDAGHGPVSFALEGVTATGDVDYTVTELITRNVLGILPGSGPDRDEYVVIGGHHDHLGERGGTIHNGADDNASGTAGVIEAAYALAAVPDRNRSVLFMTFSGEEIGLLGSKHFVDNPTIPLDAIVAMLNMDMIGRLNRDTIDNMLEVQGLGTGDSLRAIVDRRAEDYNFKFIPDDSALGPSDHAPFYRAGIPALFFHTGLHPDYHAPGDDVEKVNASGGAEVTALVAAVALDVIALAEPPQYVVVDRPAVMVRAGSTQAQQSGAPRVVIGIRPGEADESGLPGWSVGEVTPGGPAAHAGMQAGDRIVRVAGREVGGFGDYREAVREKKGGDVVDVVVRRGSQELTLSVTLQAR